MFLEHWKSSRWGTRLAWLSRDLLEEFRQKKKMYVHWIRGQATWEDRDAVCLCREKICAVKAQLELKVFSTVGNTHTHIHTKQNKQTKKMFKNMLTAKGGLGKT